MNAAKKAVFIRGFFMHVILCHFIFGPFPGKQKSFIGKFSSRLFDFWEKFQIFLGTGIPFLCRGKTSGKCKISETSES
jgi:hypothetical protein